MSPSPKHRRQREQVSETPLDVSAPLSVRSLDSPSGILISQAVHVNLKAEDSLPFRVVSQLGIGSAAAVLLVEDLVNGRTFAYKSFRKENALQSSFENEINILKRLKTHPHIVQICWSFARKGELGMLLSPVASDGDLRAYLSTIQNDGQPLTIEQRSILNRSFSCLANALAYIHHHTIRHKDIKPQNILVHRGRMVFLDFGIALDAYDQDSTTTTGLPESFTPRYQAPEVANCEPRNRKSDVFSLGCVFLEIMAVLAPEAVTGSEDKQPYWKRIEEIKNTLCSLNNVESEYAQVFPICSSMLEPDRSVRINTQDLVVQLRQMHESEPRLHQTMNCKECENFSQNVGDSIDDDCEEFTDCSDFFPYLSQKARNAPKEDLLMKLALKPMRPFEMVAGYMYIFSHPDEPQYIHIGRSNDVFRRLREWERHCGTPLIRYGSSEGFQDGGIFCKNVSRVEQLVMNDLRDVRYERHCSGCGLRHMEYFRTSPENAARVIKKFSSRK